MIPDPGRLSLKRESRGDLCMHIKEVCHIAEKKVRQGSKPQLVC